MINHSILANFYESHVQVLRESHDRALDNAGADWCLIPSGELKYAFLDDRSYGFIANPHFKYWVPLTELAESFVIYRSGEKPILLYAQPEDYWHKPPEAPSGYWVDQFDVRIIGGANEVADHLPENLSTGIVIGEFAKDSYVGIDRINPSVALNVLHNARTRKTRYELECMRAAQTLAVAGHRAAEKAYAAKMSEYDIHMAYCQAMNQRESELPYNNIVALNENAAVLHYQHLGRKPLDNPRSFLIDAGAQVNGYAADITRTYCSERSDFRALIGTMEQLQLAVVAEVSAGVDYRELHLSCHTKITQLLQDTGIARGSIDELGSNEISRVFFPHGLGHFLGLQVHDVAGLTTGDEAKKLERPEGHEALRLTRELATDQVLTIEPGLYFIPMLLDQARNDAAKSKLLDWDVIDAFIPYGGIRIEDNVQVLENGNCNLTREAFAA